MHIAPIFVDGRALQPDRIRACLIQRVQRVVERAGEAGFVGRQAQRPQYACGDRQPIAGVGEGDTGIGRQLRQPHAQRFGIENMQRRARLVVHGDIARDCGIVMFREFDFDAQDIAELATGDRSGAKDPRRVAGQIDDGRFQSHRAGASVEHRVDAPAQAFEHLIGGGGAETFVGIGRGRGQPAVQGVEDAQQDRVIRHPQTDRGAAAGDFGRHGVGLVQQQGQRAGPERFGQPPRGVGNVFRPARQLPGAGQMHDQRVVRRALFRRENAAHSLGVQGVGGQPVHGFGGHGHQPAGAQQAHGFVDIVGAGGVETTRLERCGHRGRVANAAEAGREGCGRPTIADLSRQVPAMALKSTVVKVELQVSDMDRHYYAQHNLTLAQHPSETDARLMVRLLAFALYADERLEFGRGLSDDSEPDLWQRDYVGDIQRWIELGQPDESRIRKASARAEQVVVVNYGGQASEVWWKKNAAALARFANLTVLDIDPAAIDALVGHLQRGMRLTAMIQDTELQLMSDSLNIALTPRVRKASSK